MGHTKLLKSKSSSRLAMALACTLSFVAVIRVQSSVYSQSSPPCTHGGELREYTEENSVSTRRIATKNSVGTRQVCKELRKKKDIFLRFFCSRLLVLAINLTTSSLRETQFSNVTGCDD
jgi:hypothetical protein